MSSDDATSSCCTPQPPPSVCMVCYSDFRKTVVGITPCNHIEICGLCHLRLRSLHSDLKCPICKTANEHVIADYYTKKKTSFEEYPLWGDDLGTDFTFHESAKMFFPTSFYESTVKPLFEFQCYVKNCISATACKTLRELQDHLRKEHRLTLCNLCIDNQRDFVSKLPRYSPSGLQKHESASNSGHPLCGFCRPQRFYDLTALHLHLAQEHYKCHVCEMHLDKPNQFFRNYRSLERHFDREHFMCHDAQCLQARFVVFPSELDLRHHERQVHGRSSGDTKLQLEFHMRRPNTQPQQQQTVPSESDFNYSVDGQAFVPAPLPTVDENQLHPPHVERTAQLREQAAQIRSTQQEEKNQNTAFPSLKDNLNQQHDAQERLTVGWTQEGVARVGRTQSRISSREDFPSLPVSQQQSSKMNRHFTTPRTTTNRQNAIHPATTGSLRAIATYTKNNTTSSGGWSSSNNTSIPLQSTTTNNNISILSSLGATTASSTRAKPPAMTSDQFPTLTTSSNGNHSTPIRYTAAQNYTARQQQQLHHTASVVPTALDFPALSGGVRKKSAPKPAPNLSSSEFPSIRSTFVSSMNGTKAVTVDDMKATLGSSRYKQLKQYTKEFATHEMAPDAFVDHAASLFDQGYADRDFWSFVPTLIESCPMSVNKDAALRYMEQLHRLRNGAKNAEAAAQQKQQQAALPSNWLTSTPALPAPTTNEQHINIGYAAANAYHSKKQSSSGRASNAWAGGRSGGGSGTHLRTTPTTPSVTQRSGGVNTNPSENWQTNPSQKKSNNKSKGKQKNELRSLAFKSS